MYGFRVKITDRLRITKNRQIECIDVRWEEVFQKVQLIYRSGEAVVQDAREKF